MRGNNRNSIEERGKLPQFTTMNVIDGQAGLANYISLIFYSLTIDNILNIIVMLILVAVTINLVATGGLFNYARNAAGETKNAIEYERQLASTDLEEYIKGETLPEGWTKMKTIPTGWDENKVTAVTDGTNQVPLPKGYSILEVNDEAKVEKGLVIKDSNNNEFVWIPVDPNSVVEGTYTTTLGYKGSNKYAGYLASLNLNKIYLAESKEDVEPKEDAEPIFYSEPTDLSGGGYDGQSLLNSIYGPNYFNYGADFKYEAEYSEMTTQVKKYGGFYIGRYETTIETIGNKQCIGSVGDRKVLTADQEIFIKGTESKKVCKWYGLYYVQKTTDYVVGNGENVQTAMIYGQLWDKAMDFIEAQRVAGNTTYTVNSATSSWHNGTPVVDSGQANAGDVALNIFDLESNASDWTQEAYSTHRRALRGGSYYAVSAAYRNNDNPTRNASDNASRLSLYIK